MINITVSISAEWKQGSEIRTLLSKQRWFFFHFFSRAKRKGLKFRPLLSEKKITIFFLYFSGVKMLGSEFQTPGFRMKGEMHKKCGFLRKKLSCPQKMEMVKVTKTVLFFTSVSFNNLQWQEIVEKLQPSKIRTLYSYSYPPHSTTNAK